MASKGGMLVHARLMPTPVSAARLSVSSSSPVFRRMARTRAASRPQ